MTSELNKKSILNIAGGKILPIGFGLSKCKFLINIDQIYFSYTDIYDGRCRERHLYFINEISDNTTFSEVYYINHDIYNFIERYDIPFDLITIYRFLEHVPKSNVLNFIYQLSTCCLPGAELDVIVPDYEILAQRILNENPFLPASGSFEEEDIITTYELLNEQPSPHLSIWTKDRLYYFFELEKRFKVKSVEKNYNFDGRNLYLRALIERV